MNILKNFKNYFKSSAIFIFSTIAFMIMEILSYVAIPYLTKVLINNGVLKTDYRFIIDIGSMLLFIAIIGLIASIISSYYSTKVGSEFDKNIKEGIFDKIVGLSFKNIDELDLESLIDVLNNDTRSLQNLIVHNFRILFKGPVLLILCLLISSTINIKLTGIFIVALIFISCLFYLIYKKSFNKFYISEEARLGLTTYLKEHFDAIFLIKSFGTEEAEKKEFNNKTNSLLNLNNNSINLISFISPLFMLISGLGVLVILWFYKSTYLNNELLIGDIIALIFYFILFILALSTSIILFVNFSIIKCYCQRINNILTTKADITYSNNYDVPKKVIGNIEFQNVCFDYNISDGLSDVALNNINISLSKGTVLGVIGNELSGKSTFLNMIPRFYDPTSGKVLLDGIDIRNYPEATLKSSIYFNIKSETIFNCSSHNDTIDSSLVSDDDNTTRIIKLKRAKEILRYLPEIYEEIDYGAGYKFFEKQIEHPVLKNLKCKNPKIYIIDDSASNKELINKLKNGKDQLTLDSIIVINATDISSIQNADKIIIFDKGTIVATGTHNELLRTSLQYMNILKNQQSKEV